MINPRRAVVTALMKQEKNGYANLILNAALENFEGTPRDKAFISAVFYGTVERMITLDFLLAQCLTKPLLKMDAEVRAILRSGLYQAKYMDGVPISAAINESVKLTRQMGKTSAAGMVNAVLRKASGIKLETVAFENEIKRLSVSYSVSEEIAALLLQKLPERCESFLACGFHQPQLCVRVNTECTDTEEIEAAFAKQNIATERGTVPGSLYVDYKGDITATKLFKRGFLHVQGEASQLACHALQPKKGDKVLDLCAAPGGKSATLAQYMQNTGTLISCDALKNRLSLIENTFERMGVTCAQVLYNDASVYRQDFENADAVLCDVPCSGLGILSKKPDIRQKNLDGLAALVALQKQILATAARYVKKGGRLVYSTCTVNPDENEAVVTSFLKEHAEYRSVQVPNVPHGAVICDNLVTLYPDSTKTDGFFIALLERL